MRAIVLLSGGLDSYTAAAIAKSEGFELYALTVWYGQRHAREVESARAVARALGVARHLELPIDLRGIGGSSLTSDTSVPRDRDLSATDIPSTYVPARNTIFLSLALGWAEVLEACDIVIGVNVLDYSGYPDCRPEFVRAFESLATLATRAGVRAPGSGFTLRSSPSPKQRSSSGVSRWALITDLHTACYDPSPDGRPCGRCDSCALRARGFAEAGVADPLLLR